ncbi:methyltransferase family protein [Thermosporothrix hazakensis]|jgi:SAM-dependent methyltransferase|uniref:Methyltransferase family protein n=1 Tax=Thermosporothrix hazakensis TaxID=644383 RepID=A0A326U6M7_THEHA|nr:class I SAM-dependent methyltransferase [Thermosporothrix hazakensis]PZW29520.1 methyltransferase family protein [Thermosporothrix hazakensis]GCE45765.1 hypothetical protein KTH_06340 [Thermosporothrix hazakensis]
MTTNIYSSLWFQLFMPLQNEEWTRKDVAFLARQLPLPRYKRVLDLCCGYGRHALLLADYGYTVTGLDRDRDAIAEARRRARKAGKDIQYVQGDMRELEALSGEFDAVINMWQSFCYFDEETNRHILRQIYRKLVPAGRFVIDMYNRTYYEGHHGTKRQDINGFVVETSVYLEGNRLHSVVQYADESGIQGSDHFEFQMFTAEEFSELAASCGFTTRLVCSSSDENIAPTAEHPRMQLVLEKS